MNEVKRDSVVIIWILGALATVTPFAIDLYLPAFAQIADEFGDTTAGVSLSVSSYFIGMAVGQILYGPLLDRFGRKRPLYAGMILFIVASIGCMLSWNVDVLIIFRFIQALGGSVAWVAAVSMVRDFFPVEQSARVFSLLILILGVSPLLAPTVGGFITTAWGWQAIFGVLGGIALLILIIVYLFLPEGHQPDPTVSLNVRPMWRTFANVLKEPQFYTYTFAGAFAFSTLFIYVAGSPVIFMEIHQVTPQAYGVIFAILSIGFIGGSQFNIYLTRKKKSERIFKAALVCQVLTNVIFFIAAWYGLLDLYTTILLFFICLSCVGLTNPNATALALAPFEKNIGSASALLGCSQIGVAALASIGVGLFGSTNTLSIVSLMVSTSFIAVLILLAGRKRINEIVTGKGPAKSGVH